MTTIREKMEEMLFEHGLFEDQATAIMEQAVKQEDFKHMEGRWDDKTEEYPSQFTSVLWLSIKDIALCWIDENMPGAWFRPLFTDGGNHVENRI